MRQGFCLKTGVGMSKNIGPSNSCITYGF